MNAQNFKRRTSKLRIPKDVIEQYEVVKGCGHCQRQHPAPPRSRITGMRATTLGELLCIGHADLTFDKVRYAVLAVVDAMSNSVWVGPQQDKTQQYTFKARFVAMMSS
eukprot:11966705-Prorocentrum_lima.AAC.2